MNIKAEQRTYFRALGAHSLAIAVYPIGGACRDRCRIRSTRGECRDRWHYNPGHRTCICCSRETEVADVTRHYVRIRAELERAGTPIGNMDVLSKA
jgi:hypothetical protein